MGADDIRFEGGKIDFHHAVEIFLGIIDHLFVEAEQLRIGTHRPRNLEPALRVGDALGGHLVSGHVDGIGKMISRADDARSIRMKFEVPGELAQTIDTPCNFTAREIRTGMFCIHQSQTHRLAAQYIIDFILFFDNYASAHRLHRATADDNP